MITANDNSDNDNMSNTMNLLMPSTDANQRMRHISIILHSLPYFFNSMLDDDNLEKQLLVELGDCILISCSKLKENPEPSWYLVIKEPNEVISRTRVIYRQKTLKIWNNKNTTLYEYIKKRPLKMIERPWKIHPDQVNTLTNRMMTTVSSYQFPINNQTFPLGILSQKILNFDCKRCLPVIELSITDCNIDELKILIAEAERRRGFGSIRIWRLWGVCQYATETVSLVLEDIIYGAASEFIRTNPISQTQLCKFAAQIVDGLRNLEKHSFVHRRLSIDVCLLTYNYNIKLAIYGLTPGELFPTNDDFDDIDRCRWLPPECLPDADNITGSYGTPGMIYSYGMILWSMFHGALLPYEDEPAINIRNRQYRIKNLLYIEPELVPNKIRDVILSCWSEDIAIRGRLKNIKLYLQKYLLS
uniref:Protein kinase domain-containing protein n=1 Tax=Setaria digitata TaxID=48799 RepID=A0A915Q3M4_9BILA